MSQLVIQSLVWHVATWYTIIGMTCRYLIYNHWYDMSLLDIQSLVWHFATWYTIIGMTCRYLIYMYDITLLDIQSLVWHVATWYKIIGTGMKCRYLIYNCGLFGLTISWLCLKYSKRRSNVMSSYKSAVFFNFTCLEKNQPLDHTLLFTLIEVTWLVRCWMYEVFVYGFGNNIMITVIRRPQWSMCLPQ